MLKAMRELSEQYPRYSYRRIQVFLERQGQVMSADRVHRIWRFAGLPSAQKAATAQGCDWQAAPFAGFSGQSRLGLRLRV